MPDFLTQILKQKKLEVAKQKQKKSLFDYESEFEKKKENRFSKKLLLKQEHTRSCVRLSTNLRLLFGLG